MGSAGEFRINLAASGALQLKILFSRQLSGNLVHPAIARKSATERTRFLGGQVSYNVLGRTLFWCSLPDTIWFLATSRLCPLMHP